MLTFVPTPIGNLGDLSLRSIDILKDAELILCEDTRVTKKLIHLINTKLSIYIDTTTKEFKSVHSHNEQEFLTNHAKEILQNKNVVFVSDAGMPCISDPGALLVDFCIKYNIKYDILPGANAVLTAFAMSGFNNKEFTFFGFLAHKGKDRQNKLYTIMEHHCISILYESPHRLLKLLQQIETIDQYRKIFVVKELTKIYQQSFKGTVRDINNQLKNTTIKGEWVVIIDNLASTKGEPLSQNDIIELNIPPKQKAKLLAKLSGDSVKKMYDFIQEQI